MSKYTTSPVNEAGMTRVEVVASNGVTPTVVTRDEVWMSNGVVPTAQGVTGHPTVRGDDRIRMINGATPTAHLLRVIVATQGTTSAAEDCSPVITAQERLAA